MSSIRHNESPGSASTATSHPSRTICRTAREPMKPPPPVTKQRMSERLRGIFAVDGIGDDHARTSLGIVEDAAEIFADHAHKNKVQAMQEQHQNHNRGEAL